jgi:heterodisulfide reductase subunit B
MKEYLLYLGCTIPVRHPTYEISTKLVLEKLGVKLHSFKDVTCCGAQYIESLSSMAHMVMNGRILARAEQENKDILALCGACNSSLKHNKYYLDESDVACERVNQILSEEGLEYTGSVEVKHLLEVIRDDIGYEKIRKSVEKMYDGVRLAAHYGCHVTRPYEILHVDDPEHPTVIDRTIEAVGGIAVDYPRKTRCCGAPIIAMDDNLAYKIGIDKINNVKAAGAQGIITACVFCDIQLSQVQIGGELDANSRIPVMTISQLLGPALGIDEEELGIHLSKINPDSIFSTLQEV